MDENAASLYLSGFSEGAINCTGMISCTGKDAYLSFLGRTYLSLIHNHVATPDPNSKREEGSGTWTTGPVGRPASANEVIASNATVKTIVTAFMFFSSF